ncbi:uncharacterized protein LOC124915137 [Impatiens glandulifera]|uniref:uncharacterized protein LOC124915137 n=1 Tax=Impatiens glandulifera TaxID=253017 RepID=UPI001FB189AE|nr:uncharacterized protein LOC124915137 [Impatiens glandulifera]
MLVHTIIRFIRPTTVIGRRSFSTLSKHTDMAQKNNDTDPKQTSGDEESHSFGEGYSTRSDDDGFGANQQTQQQPLNNDDQEDAKTKNLIKEGHPEFDHTQGSKVAEKEKARFQK